MWHSRISYCTVVTQCMLVFNKNEMQKLSVISFKPPFFLINILSEKKIYQPTVKVVHFNCLCSGLKENVSDNLRYLNTRCPVGDAVWRILGWTALELDCETKALCCFQFTLTVLSLHLSMWAFSFLFWLPCLPTAILHCCDGLFLLWNCSPNKPFLIRLPWLGCFITAAGG